MRLAATVFFVAALRLLAAGWAAVLATVLAAVQVGALEALAPAELELLPAAELELLLNAVAGRLEPFLDLGRPRLGCGLKKLVIELKLMKQS